MQSLTQPELLLKPFAESGDKNTLPVTNTDASNPQLADLTNGFPQVTSEDPDDGGLPPERKDFNGLGYLTTTYDYFYQAGGTFTFSPTISSAIGGYPLGARLWYTDSNGATTVVRSTIANNTDNFNNGSATGIGTTWVPEIPALGWNNVWTGNNTFSGNNTYSGTNSFSGSVYFNGGCTVANSTGNLEITPSSSTTVGGNIDFHFAGSSSSYTSRIIEDANGQLSIKGNRLMVPNSATIGSAISTAAISKSANGYVKLGNGMIIQWGIVAISEYSSVTVTLPTSFTSTNYSVCANYKVHHTAADSEGCMTVDNFKTTTFRLSCGAINPNSGNTNWIAIGY